MVRGSSSLTVAVVAGILLVVVVGVDASMTRTLELDVETEEGFSLIATSAEEAAPRGLAPVVEANRTDEVGFRLSVDNGYAWAYDEEFSVYTGGERIASGTLEAPRSSMGETFFEVSAETFLAATGPRDEPGQTHASVEVDLEGTWLWGSFILREVPG